jgi:hypothetical protein
MGSDHKQLRHEFQKVLTGVIKHWKEIQAMQSEVSSLTAMVQEICNAILPNTPPIPPCVPFAALQISDDLSSLQSTAIPALFSPPHTKVAATNRHHHPSIKRPGIHKLSGVQA